LPNHYLIFTLSSELLANKVVIKIFQNYKKTAVNRLCLSINYLIFDTLRKKKKENTGSTE